MKVAIYCRLSEEDRNKLDKTDDSESIQNQKALLVQYANQHHWSVHEIYSDDDYTGSDRNRPAWNRLLQDAEAQRFDIILCKTQSRFTRELELVEKYIHSLFPLWGIRFVSVVDGADTTVKGNKKARQINGLVNEWYLEDLSDNIRAVLTSKRQSGLHIGSFALYGYQKDPDQKGHLIIDQDAAAVVREVFQLFRAGWGKTAIARILNDRGTPNPTEYKRQKGLRYQQPDSRNGTLWRYDTISKMLSNETYIGNLVQSKYGSISYKARKSRPLPQDQWIRVEGTHEPIIDRDTWDQVSAMLKQRAKPFKTGTIGLFSKKVVCMHCGYAMRSSKNRGLYYLKCSTRHTCKDACIGSFLSVNTLERAILQELRDLIDQYLDRDAVECQVQSYTHLQRMLDMLKEDQSTHKKRLMDYTKGVKHLYLDKVRGIISETEFLEFSEDFHGEKERLERQITETRHQIEALEAQMESGEDGRGIIEDYANTQALTREMVEELIGLIVIGKREATTNNVPIVIHWNF